MLSVNKIFGTNSNTSFKGQFFRTHCLDKAIESASEYDLYKFSKILKRMTNTNDNFIFELYQTNTSDSVKIELCKYKEFHSSKHTIVEKINTTADFLYKDVIAGINRILEGIYPEQMFTNIPRETSIRRINKILL